MKRVDDHLKKKGTLELNQYLSINKKILSDLKTNSNLEREFQYLNALGHKTRFLIYHHLKVQPNTTSSLAAIFDMKENAINYHLKELEKAGLIFAQKEGYYTVYSSNHYLFEIEL